MDYKKLRLSIPKSLDSHQLQLFKDVCDKCGAWIEEYSGGQPRSEGQNLDIHSGGGQSRSQGPNLDIHSGGGQPRSEGQNLDINLGSGNDSGQNPGNSGGGYVKILMIGLAAVVCCAAVAFTHSKCGVNGRKQARDPMQSQRRK